MPDNFPSRSMIVCDPGGFSIHLEPCYSSKVLAVRVSNYVLHQDYNNLMPVQDIQIHEKNPKEILLWLQTICRPDQQSKARHPQDSVFLFFLWSLPGSISPLGVTTGIMQPSVCPIISDDSPLLTTERIFLSICS